MNKKVGFHQLDLKLQSTQELVRKGGVSKLSKETNEICERNLELILTYDRIRRARASES